MRKYLPILAAALFVLSWTGCARSGLGLRAPGSIRQQQFRATLHDPYPDHDAGPATDNRPPGFTKPQAEPVRARQVRDMWWRQ